MRGGGHKEDFSYSAMLGLGGRFRDGGKGRENRGFCCTGEITSQGTVTKPVAIMYERCKNMLFRYGVL